MEERSVYGPAEEVAGARDAGLADLPRQHEERVTEATGLFQEIDGLQPTARRFIEGVKELRAALGQRIWMEENDFWPHFVGGLGRRSTRQAGDRLQAAKDAGIWRRHAA